MDEKTISKLLEEHGNKLINELQLKMMSHIQCLNDSINKIVATDREKHLQNLLQEFRKEKQAIKEYSDILIAVSKEIKSNILQDPIFSQRYSNIKFFSEYKRSLNLGIQDDEFNNLTQSFYLIDELIHKISDLSEDIKKSSTFFEDGLDCYLEEVSEQTNAKLKKLLQHLIAFNNSLKSKENF